MAKLLRVKPFVFLNVAWLAGLARLHAWAADTEARTASQDQNVVAMSMSSASKARGTVRSPVIRERGR